MVPCECLKTVPLTHLTLLKVEREDWRQFLWHDLCPPTVRHLHIARDRSATRYIGAGELIATFRVRYPEREGVLVTVGVGEAVADKRWVEEERSD
jgi:hypothetical protein